MRTDEMIELIEMGYQLCIYAENDGWSIAAQADSESKELYLRTSKGHRRIFKTVDTAVTYAFRKLRVSEVQVWP